MRSGPSRGRFSFQGGVTGSADLHGVDPPPGHRAGLYGWSGTRLRVERVEHEPEQEPERDGHDDRGDHEEREPHELQMSACLLAANTRQVL